MAILALLLSLSIQFAAVAQNDSSIVPVRHFIATPISFPADMQGFDANIRGRLRVQSEPITNEYNPQVIDTLRHVRVRGAAVSFYDKGDDLLWYKMDISGKKVPLTHGVHLGMTRDELKSQLTGLKTEGENEVGEDASAFGKVIFTLKRDKVKSIYLERYIE